MSEYKDFDPEEVKDATANAIIAMEGCKYVIASILSEKDSKVTIHHECSQNQLALIVKGMLSMNKVLMLDVVSWGNKLLQHEVEKSKNKN